MKPPRLRVVGGSVGGRRLVAPAGTSTRPTKDRVKESLFAALGDARVAGAVVLDLYAGSGALAIEALSRGAARAVLVDHDRAAVAAVERNLAATGFTERARVQRGTAESVTRRPPPAEAPFDLVFLDPPYGQPPAELEAVLAGLAQRGWLAARATVVVERGGREAAGPAWPEGWAGMWERAYGDTLVSVAETDQ
ncbi:MAG TPA: 16S rRNA (guanine(966)-N(2))-methyltransferase RsmD [Acidimicrobiia bacterium]